MKLLVVWSPSARIELRRVDRETAMRILLALTRFARIGEGDVKALEGGSRAHSVCALATGVFVSKGWLAERSAFSPSRVAGRLTNRKQALEALDRPVVSRSPAPRFAGRFR